MPDHEYRLADSARRLRTLIRERAPAAIVRNEVRLLIGAAVDLYGAARLRTWVDDAVTKLAALLTCPDGPDCVRCGGLGRVFTPDGEDPQCGGCGGSGVVPAPPAAGPPAP